MSILLYPYFQEGYRVWGAGFQITFWCRRPTGDIVTEACFHILSLTGGPPSMSSLKWKSLLVVLKWIKLLKLPATHRRHTTIMFSYNFLEVTGTALEKSWTSFNFSSMFAVGRRKLKWSVSINEINVASGSPVGRRWVAGGSPVGRWWVTGTRNLYWNQALSHNKLSCAPTPHVPIFYTKDIGFGVYMLFL